MKLEFAYYCTPESQKARKETKIFEKHGFIPLEKKNLGYEKYSSI